MTQKETITALDPMRPITSQLARLLRERIIRNQLQPGNRISESEIAKTYEISRQPVREAFIKLQEQGLLTVLPQRGTVVSKIAYLTVLDARFLREAFEADIVRVLAGECADGVVPALRDLIAQQQDVSHQGDTDAFTRLDEQFHQKLAEAAGKGGAWKLIEGVKSQMDRVRFLSLENFPMDRLVQQHTAIVDAIAQRDAGSAEQSARHHLREMLDYLPGVVAANPDFFDLPAGAMGAPINTPILGGGNT